MDILKEWEQKAIEYIFSHPGAATPERVSDYDWGEAFAYAATPETYPGSAVLTTPFAREDVLVVIAAEDGEGDGASWVGVFLLKDGRFAVLRAGCDFTGWDCQAGGSANVAESLESLVRFGLSQDERDRLNFKMVI